MEPTPKTRDPEAARRTFARVRAQYEDWARHTGDRPRGRPIDLLANVDPDRVAEMAGLVAGVLAGLMLLALAAVALRAALFWGAIARNGAAVGYAAVTFFLVAAGVGALAATLNHHRRLRAARAHPRLA
jgi:hypothetical protein